jgi:hypothetical protein
MAIRCLDSSPTDALIDLKVRCRLGRFIPIWHNLDTLAHRHIGTSAHRHIAPVPQRRPACWGDARWLCIRPNVLQYLTDVGGRMSAL